MLINVSRLDVWSAIVPDQPGAIAKKLESLAKAGANLDLILSWRNMGSPNQSDLVIGPLTTEAQSQAAVGAGFRHNSEVAVIVVEGPNEPGMGFRVTRSLAEEGLNLKGIAVSTLGNRVCMHIALDSSKDAERAAQVLQRSM
jgi:predicted amino acid-binding ACT domain protein